MKENLMFGHLGNGVFVCDRNRLKDNDYMKVAHIGYYREITFYTREISKEAHREIEDFARNGNMAVSVCQPDSFALCSIVNMQ